MMDWSLILVILAVVFLVGHMFLDVRGLVSKVRQLQHNEGVPLGCPTCRAIDQSKQVIRHEAIWTAAAVIALTGHIVMDFVR